MAMLGDERLFALLESHGEAVARGEAAAFEDGVVAELVERTAWAKVEVVSDDEREQGNRIHLNLGHTLGHAIETAAGYAGILHGEAVAYGLRAACRLGVLLEVTPADRAARAEALLTALRLGVEPVDLRLDAVLAAMGRDKKHAGGRLRWVLPTETGVTVRPDVPADLVARVAAGVLAGSGAALAPAGGRA
jgi:3-dehydroquinate synthetase